MTTTHTLVSTGWRVVRPDEQKTWHVFRVEWEWAHGSHCFNTAGCYQFDKLWEALDAIKGEA